MKAYLPLRHGGLSEFQRYCDLFGSPSFMIRISSSVIIIAVNRMFLLSFETKNDHVVCNHSVNSSSHSVNGDIAIQWEWSNFDHS